MLKVHPGWTVADYWAAPALYCDWADRFDQAEAAAIAKANKPKPEGR